jgi:DNA-binding MarR family transcriptional regulator
MKRKNIQGLALELLSSTAVGLKETTLAEKIGVLPHSVYTACKRLEDLGLVKTDNNKPLQRKWFRTDKPLPVEKTAEQRSREIRDRAFPGLARPESAEEQTSKRLLDSIGDGTFWTSLVRSDHAGDLMLAALQRLFERLRADEDELAEVKGQVKGLEVANKGLLRDIEQAREGNRILRKQRDEALAKAAKEAFVEHTGKR